MAPKALHRFRVTNARAIRGRDGLRVVLKKDSPTYVVDYLEIELNPKISPEEWEELYTSEHQEPVPAKVNGTYPYLAPARAARKLS